MKTKWLRDENIFFQFFFLRLCGRLTRLVIWLWILKCNCCPFMYAVRCFLGCSMWYVDMRVCHSYSGKQSNCRYEHRTAPKHRRRLGTHNNTWFWHLIFIYKHKRQSLSILSVFFSLFFVVERIDVILYVDSSEKRLQFAVLMIPIKLEWSIFSHRLKRKII